MLGYALTTATFLFVMNSTHVKAQESKQFTVGAGQAITDVLTKADIFMYPEFLKGLILYVDNTQSPATLNYNVFLGKMMFLGNRKDTLVITNAETVKWFILDLDTFVYQKEYYRYLAGNDQFRLLSKRYTKLVDVKKEGAYGSSNSTGAVDSYSSLSTNNSSKLYQLRVNEETVFSIRTEYYFKNSTNEPVQATKGNLFKMFPDKTDQIKSYLKTESIRFNKMEDMVKLSLYIQEII